MSGQVALMLASHQPPMRVVDSADFDGTNDYMTRGGALNGAANSKTGIVSFWFRNDGGTGIRNFFEHAGQGGLSFGLDGGNSFFADGELDDANDVMGLYSGATTYGASSTWHHVLFSWDLTDGGTSRRLYIDDVNVQSGGGLWSNSNINWATATDWFVGADSAGASKFNGAIAELYLAPGQFLDFSIVANRRKFITADGKPVHLGTTGALPTGTAPLVYHHIDDGEAVANFATNRGTGGNFSITGTLDTGSTSPSD